MQCNLPLFFHNEYNLVARIKNLLFIVLFFNRWDIPSSELQRRCSCTVNVLPVFVTVLISVNLQPRKVLIIFTAFPNCQ